MFCYLGKFGQAVLWSSPGAKLAWLGNKEKRNLCGLPQGILLGPLWQIEKGFAYLEDGYVYFKGVGRAP